MVRKSKPDFDRYFMTIATSVRARADCVGTRVGAVLTVGRRIVSAGYNGTPTNMPNCTEGGCYRCKERGTYGRGQAYDVCICVHAEQNTLLAAARLGIPVRGGVLYTTSRPCFTCLKELVQCGVTKVYYLNEWEHPDANVGPQYGRLESRIVDGVVRLDMDDPQADWAVGRDPASPNSEP